MSSFGRGRGIIPSSYPNPPPPIEKKNGTVHTNKLPTTKVAPQRSSPPHTKVVPQRSSPPLTLLPQNNSSKIPDLHTFGETLITLKEEESLFPIILDIINSPECTVETIDRMVQIVVDRCMWFPMISKKYSALLNFLSSHNVFGKEIRCFTFNTLQMFYEDRESLLLSKKYGDDTFRNAVILTGEIYYRYRIGDSRCKIFSKPVFDYLKMLSVSSDEKDLQTLTQQLSWSSREIAKTDENSISELMLIIRKNLTHDSYSVKGKTFLMLCIELQTRSFDELSEEVKRFYCNELGEETFYSIKPPSLELDNHIEYYNSIRKFFS